MLHVITPSRGRPGNAARLQQALRETCAGGFLLVLGVDRDDPDLPAYRQLSARDTTVVPGERRHLTGWTNLLANSVIYGGQQAQWLASLGDDHLPRTPGWDEKLIGAIQAMDGPGWAYGDDLLRHEDIPTAWVQSAELVKALGWMMLPACHHLGVDLAVRDLGRAAGRIAYEPTVVVEHLHFVNDKAPHDATYEHGNNPTRIRDDNHGHAVWLGSEHFVFDVAAVKSLRWEA